METVTIDGMKKLPSVKGKRALPAMALLAALLLSLTVAATRTAVGQPASPPTADHHFFLPFIARPYPAPDLSPVAPAYGVNFISSAEAPADAQQYQNGLATGAAWNRWPIYWFFVETAPDQFDWSTVDTAVSGDVAHGLRTNAILLGTPGFYTTGLPQEADAARPARWRNFTLTAANSATPRGLYDGVFADGSDVPGPGKGINPDNKWARFVYAAVQRYRPGGVLARAQNWPAAAGVTHWEVWNEPDLPWFWDGSLPDYARLLKVAYLTIKHADPDAVVLTAGMANALPQYSNYYADVLAIYAADPLAAQHNYFHDIFATHNYFDAWQSWYHVWRGGRAMENYGLDKPIWLTESGVPAWNDYPGPVWDSRSALRATMSEQADYLIQNAFYALFAGADAYFHFQLYDGCGNQPPGTDFPPHNGELCDADGYLIDNPGYPCAGDANGLFRNPSDALCFTQHPQPETARPNLAAYRVLTTYLRDVTPYWRQRPGADKCIGPGNVMVPGQEWIAFYQPSTGKRIVGMWALCGEEETAVIPATNPAGTALLIAPDGGARALTADNGAYTISLPGATNRNTHADGAVPAYYPIGGRPFILIEPDP